MLHPKELNLKPSERVLKYTDSRDIFRHYLGFDYNLKELYNSPLRDNDVNPSFNLYLNPRGELKYKDFGHSQGTCFDFVRKLYGLNNTYESCKQIDNDMNLGIFKTPPPKAKKVTYNNFKNKFIKKNTILQIIPQNFTKVDKAYWDSYEIKKSTLDLYKVYSAKKVFYNKKLILKYSPTQPIYAYKFGEKLKIYRPLSNKFKWMTNTDRFDIQGLKQLPESGEILIITKSLKDVMIYYELGIPAIAPHSETMNIPESIIDQIFARFDNVIINYDNDESGKKNGKYLADKLGVVDIYTPDGFKDPAQLTKKEGIKETEKWLKKEGLVTNITK